MAKAKRKNKRTSAILSELQDPAIIYMFGGNPVYKHNNIEYARAGIKTAGNTIKSAFNRAKDDALKEANAQINYYERQEIELVNNLGTSAEELLKVINTQPLSGASENVTLADLGALLLSTKATTTKASNISTRRDKMKKATHKIGGLDLAPEEMVDLNKQMRSQIWTSFNEFLQSTNYLESESFHKKVDAMIDKYFTKSDKDKRFKAKAAYTQFQQDLGTVWEMSVEGKEIKYKGWTAKFENVSRVFKSGQKEESFNKTDTVLRFYRGGVKESFFTISFSDKTSGAATIKHLEKEGQKWLHQLSFYPYFTASISDGLSQQAQSRTTFGALNEPNEGDEPFSRAARYVAMNANKNVGMYYRRMIAAAIVWSAIVAEIGGMLEPKGKKRTEHLPLFIRHMGKFYRTSDLLKDVVKASTISGGLGIISEEYIVKKYLSSWINGAAKGDEYDKNSEDLPKVLSELQAAKKNYLITQSVRKQKGEPYSEISYKGLYEDLEVRAALKSVNGEAAFAKQLNLSVQIRLRLDHFQALS